MTDPTPQSAARGLCGSCRHWDHAGPHTGWAMNFTLKPLPGAGPSYKDESTERRQRDAEARYGLCKVIDLLDGYDPIDEADLPLAFCKDGSDYMAHLYTRAEFGCAMWEAEDD